MSMKEKITSFLFGQKPGEAAGETVPAGSEPAGEAAPEPVEASPADEALLKLPEEHQLYRLYNRRRQETGYLPAPRICLDEEGELPPDVVTKERNRLRTVLTSVCNARLKEAREQRSRNSGKKKQKEKEAEEQESGPPALDALPFFFLSTDKLYAWLMVLPPIRQGAELSRDMLYGALAEQGICYGVDTRAVDRLSHDDRRYFTLYLIARGTPAFDGKNGNIVDNFPRVIERVLEVDEFDQVDYTSLNLIQNVKQGQEICHLIEPTEGEPGRSVLDEEIPAKSGKAVPLPKGRNTEISEDGIQLLAAIAGSVEFSGRSFQVKPVLEIPGDVDFSTGNLNFLGDINIHGNILSGFTVRAMGNIHVDGVVETGGTVEAGGDLVVVKGIVGDGSTTVQVHRSLFSKYVENATVCVGETLQTDCIIGSSVYCDGEILTKSGRGSIMGGRVWAAKRICANVVGSQSECKTAIVLGGKPCSSFEKEILHREANRLEMELEKLECQPESPVRFSLLGKTKIQLMTAQMKLRQLEESEEKEQEAEKEKEQEEKGSGRLECGIAYPGTKICYESEVLRLREVSRRCVFSVVKGEIVAI